MPLTSILRSSLSPGSTWRQIDLGRIDAAISTFQATPARFKSSLLFEYDDVLITHASQRLAPVTAETLSGSPIIVVSFEGEQDGVIEGFISERGLARRSEMYDRASFERAMSASKQPPRIAISLPHFLALPAFLDGPGNGSDRTSPARRCLRPQHPDCDPRASLPHHPSGSSFALARAPRRRRLARLVARCHGAGDGAPPRQRQSVGNQSPGNSTGHLAEAVRISPIRIIASVGSGACTGFRCSWSRTTPPKSSFLQDDLPCSL